MTADRRTSNLAVLFPPAPREQVNPEVTPLKAPLVRLLVVFAILLALTLGGWL